MRNCHGCEAGASAASHNTDSTVYFPVSLTTGCWYQRPQISDRAECGSFVRRERHAGALGAFRTFHRLIGPMTGPMPVV